MTILCYNPEALRYEIKASLTELKGAAIADINVIQIALKQGCISPEQFERFCSMELDELIQIATDQSALLDRLRSEKTNL